MKRPRPISESVRRELGRTKIPRYRIAIEIDVDPSQLNKFFHREANLSTAALDRLGQFLGLSVTRY